MQEGEEREKGAERIFEEIIAKNLTNLMKDININTQDVQQTLIDEQRDTYLDIIIKLSKDNKNILKAGRKL